jgi:hypothetical protein
MGRKNSLALLAAVQLAGTALAGSAATAQAAITTAVSSNWSGYAINGTRFRRVSGTWKVPRGSCSSGRATYSAAWVGLGGFSETSQALEQTGTELDCSASGRATYSAWYELVPADAKTIKMKVRSGDTISASVAVSGKRVSLRLSNLTRKATFARTLSMSAPDVTSAEWIVEAPSGCDNSGNCRQLPLADFGTVPFKSARATTTSGHSGTISDSTWSATRMNLSSSAGAIANALSASGSAFSVSYESNSSFGKPAATMPVLKRHVG